MTQHSMPTGKEIFFDESEIIVSKTDLTGKITYANHMFMKVSGYSEDELIGAPHSILRHPDMPRCVFKLLWDTISTGKEIFAYVNNMAKNGDNYWVYAHVTPTYDAKGTLIGYHSSRRVPRRDAVQKVSALYKTILTQEQQYNNRKEGMQAGLSLVTNLLQEQGTSYDEFVFSL
jgi:PAS domain S-box-containing protein